METKWILSEIKSKLTNFDLPIDNNILNILANRGIVDEKDIVSFINPNLENLEDPLRLKDLDLAASYILEAIKQNQNICIYGDYDVDGITSTSLLYLVLKQIGAKNLDYYIPLRNEGYGLNKDAIKEIKDKGTDLIITVDCGISSYYDVEYINELDMKVIVTDHHDLPSDKRLPRSLACINPKRTDNEYSFPNIAGVGVAFLLSYELFRRLDMKDEIYNYLDIATLGTIADIMPIIKENRIIVKYGLEKLRNSKNLGLRTILNKTELTGKELTTGDISFKIAPIFNAAGRLADAKLGVKLLISDNQNEINVLADNLISNNIDRRKIQDEIIENVLNELKDKDLSDKYILISHSPLYHHGIIGIVASKVLETYYKPCIIMEENPDEGIAVASCRSIEGFNITKALSSVSKLLVKFGGHANAAGFTIKLENLEQFKKEIEKYAKNELENIKLTKNIKIDMKIPAQKVSYEFIQSLNLLKPFGFGNPTPLLLSENCIIHNPKTVGNTEQHLKFDIDQKGFSVKNAIWFNGGSNLKQLKKNNIFYDVVFKLETNEYKDRFYPSILIEDMKESKLKDDRFQYYHSMYNTSFPMKSVFYTTLDLEDIDIEKIYLKRSFNTYTVMSGQRALSKLDTNVSTLLSNLNDFYGFEFEIKMENVEIRENHKIVHILIKRNYEIQNYSNQDKVQFRNIKKQILGEQEYNDVTKEILSKYYKEDESVFISNNNISYYIDEDKIKIKEQFYYPLLLTIGMKYFFDHDKKMVFYTKNKFFVKNNYLRNYFEFKNKVDIKDKIDNAIFDFNSIGMPIFKLKYEKAVFFCDKDYTKTKLYVIKKETYLPPNIFRLNKKILSSIDYDKIFLEYLPIKNKLSLIKEAKIGQVIYTDDSIIEYF
ncbi:single-stranded-DNA-specific exonuclease RecJ [Streptobacillus felis]|uniref:Single-stranded-DNA-specific exonuclease RecJ n=1 Tax=Streptobacillus felis TaxID=1384509 RepID=A0A7Z0TA58_9FUSO|nr:single-stranded-DNA-specific exonuclease RecJ [Streptobacillus felis]NYV27652.1 single-stranded-DNA-specific exonuclease RecJ [Streptobacillus felis]